jgi:hypothetical protein
VITFIAPGEEALLGEIQGELGIALCGGVPLND